MISKRRGSKQVVNNRVYGRFWLGGDKRESVPLPAVRPGDASAIESRCDLVADVTYKLIRAGRADKARDIAEQLGAATSKALLEKIVKASELLVSDARVLGDGITFKQFGIRWTSGELARAFPDHVKHKATSGDDEQILRDYVYPKVGSTALRVFRLEDGERVMAELPPELSRARRRHVAQAMHRLLGYAVYPAKIIPAHPFPKGFLPKLGPGKAKQCLYPDEDRKLMACTAIPLVDRLLYGMVAREGYRFTEARRLDWADCDTNRGVVTLDKNKTADPRAWAMDRGVTAALAIWKERCRDAKPFERIPDNEKQAERFRDHVTLAGIDRDALHRSTETSRHLVFHDLRATFVTVALANGKSEAWISDRTGHRSSSMIAKYRRAARTYAELNLGPLTPLHEAIVWSEDCQNSVKGNPKYDSQLKRAPGQKIGSKYRRRDSNPHAQRAADFESDVPSSDEPKAQKNRGVGARGSPTAGTFDTSLTDLGEIRKGWSAYEVALDAMVSS